MIIVRFLPLCCLSALSILTACKDIPAQHSTVDSTAINAHETEIKEQFVGANQRLMQKENDDMDAYMRSHKLPFIKTGSGIRYYVYEPSAKGDSIRDGDIVRISYKVYLLNGTLAYSSDVDGEKELEVGKDAIESGIHKGLQLLKRGDRAFLMLPSALAHGLLGDMKNIPPQMPIVYDLQVK